MDAEVYSDDDVARLITENFVPVRVHVREHAEEFRRMGERFGAEWTPTILMLGADGNERHRVEGFLPADEFMAHLRLGLGRIAFSRGDFEDAEARFRNVVAEAPASEAAPEAQYWAGVSRYKSSGDAAALAETASAFRDSYQDTPWAKKASVWAKS
ncbi:MAG: thioredoxin fold domain-containing protein [Longimicrobiales bacterium]